MTGSIENDVVSLARDLVSLDSRSFVSNLAVADRVEAALSGFDIERIDYTDDAGVAKRALVAHRGPTGGIALSGHMDTVPDTGWQEDPWSARLGPDGILHGLGSTDMKGPVAAAIVAARALPESVPDHAADHHRRGDHQAGRAADRAKIGAGAAGEAVRHHRRRTDLARAGARTSQPHRVHLRRDRRAGAQQHRPRPQRELGTDPVPGGDEGRVRAAAQRCQPAGPRLRSAVQRLQRGDRQPRRRGERDRAEGHRAHQVPLLRQDRSDAGAASRA